ncbi:3',5'-cyclic-nucleotide phosphodiesterase [Pseudidiomarina sp.]|uniref:3',5'-cyclic-nucleotide phosphodiesterase n=1 Tax=Pseudidiomarina sp. TaxID=2081707 RepID=UPI00299DF021|nr:3',5'-cyclic-nucleotide phosphodiesterase [Pseudidiomarina sp.]MDX1705263.1 3',5'-cyclic-nucleotide phosphodiesterase [Pseudidiomarina sp.]
MNIKVLGCSGGIGGTGGTTCLQLSDQVLIDAGSGLGELSLSEMKGVRHVLLTHAHMDHICFLPMFLANIIGQQSEPVTVYGSEDTLAMIKKHLFNWEIWPDFTQLPDRINPCLKLQTITDADLLVLDDMLLRPFVVDHAVSTFGYSIRKANRHTVFTADTGYDPRLVIQLDTLGDIDDLILECSFPDHLQELAKTSGHLTPQLASRLVTELATPPGQVWITHLKPSYENELRQVLSATAATRHWKLIAGEP